MRDTATLFLLFLTAYLAFGCLALSQRRHWDTVIGGKSCTAGLAFTLRGAGVALLVLSCAVAIVRDGPDYGALLWGTMLSIAALGIVVTLAILSRRNSIRSTTSQPDVDASQPARPNHA